jgi:glycosyltransferase involved in cell wall biosynthesis
MISIIMLSNLMSYEGSRKDPEAKFIRAVDSYLNQTTTYPNELIIVSDGCEITNQLYKEHFSEIERVRLIKMPKSEECVFPGTYRQVGIDRAQYEIISYLDSDDILLPNRINQCVNLLRASSKMAILDQYYIFPDTQRVNSEHLQTAKIISKFTLYGINFRRVKLAWKGSTAQLVHYKDIKSKWTDAKRGEDANFINSICGEFMYNKNQLMLPIDGYVVCHHPVFGFDV